MLVAAGLKPNTADLNLEAPGVRTAPNGAVQVNDEMRTSAKHVWAVGDVTGNPMLVTAAAYAGGVAAENALNGGRQKADFRFVPHAVFTAPQVAGVGMKEDEARQKGIKVECKSLSFEHVPKAGAVRDTRGLIKLVADASMFRILGVHIVSTSAADLIHIGVMAVRHNLTVGDLIRSVFVYPTLAEAYKMAALSYKKDISKLSCCAA